MIVGFDAIHSTVNKLTHANLWRMSMHNNLSGLAFEFVRLVDKLREAF